MRKRRKDNEYFIGMVDTYSSKQKYSKSRKRRKSKVVLKRILIVAVCALILAGIVALGFVVAPAIKGFFSSLGSSTPDETPTESTTLAETQPVTTAPVEEFEFITPAIADNGEDGELLTSTIYLWNNKGFNLFYGGDTSAANYAKNINTLAASLGDDITVYNMVVPNHTEFGLPKRIISGGIETSSQADNIKYIYENTDSNIIDINCYNDLAKHASEYLYYNTDHHWTSLGAYYGYTAFCEELGLKPLNIAELEKTIIGGFTGSLCTATENDILYANPDAVEYYSLPNETSATMKERMDSEPSDVGVYYTAAEGGTLTYGVFCWGDTAQFVIKSDCNTGKKIAMVKDSYGNAMAPYMTSNYDEIHIIDYRYWDGNLKEYLEENEISEVLFLNNIMSANSTSQVDTMVESLG